MLLIEGLVQPPGRIIEFVGPGFIPGTNDFVLGRALIATTDTFGAIAALNLATAYRPEVP